MITVPELRTALLDLLHETRETDLGLIIGGGFGLYLKAEHIRRLCARTLLREWPSPRSTNDLDLFLRPELLIQPSKLKPLAEALGNLGYKPVPGAENYQFIKPGTGGTTAGSIKIDILTGPRESFQGTPVKMDDRRARPRPSIGLHAHPVDEVPTLEEGLLTETIQGRLSTGEYWQGVISIPHPFAFLMMKIFAFRDRINDSNKEYGRYHALDIYTVMATTTEPEWHKALRLKDQNKNNPYVLEASCLVSKYFSGIECLGMLRMRESPYCRPDLQLEEFMSALKELFPEYQE